MLSVILNHPMYTFLIHRLLPRRRLLLSAESAISATPAEKKNTWVLKRSIRVCRQSSRELSEPRTVNIKNDHANGELGTGSIIVRLYDDLARS